MSQNPVIIAECCQNHNGDKGILKEMIWRIAETGADYAKIQSISAEELSQRERFEPNHPDVIAGKTILRPYAPEYARLKPLELDEATQVWFIEECQRAGIKALTTAFTRSKIDFLSKLPWRSIKVASYDCASLPLIRDLRKNFEHLFISTGATFDQEVEATAQELKGTSFSFLHCVTIYPTPAEEVHMARMLWLKRFTQSVGFSDHTAPKKLGNDASYLALSLGASVIERHFSILPPDQTRDGPVSINFDELKSLVQFARLPQTQRDEWRVSHQSSCDLMMGVAKRPLSSVELKNRDYYRGRFVSHLHGKTFYNWEESSGT